jgi:transposase InsO family protein
MDQGDHGKPEAICSGNGREFISSTVVGFLVEHGVEPMFIAKASPTQNPFIERFNGTMRRDLLNVEEFETVLEAQDVVNLFTDEFNSDQAHRGLSMKTPHEFAEGFRLATK